MADIKFSKAPGTESNTEQDFEASSTAGGIPLGRDLQRDLPEPSLPYSVEIHMFDSYA
jgi:hypothetical protein